MVGNKILLSPSCPMPLCKGSKLAQYSIRETFFIRLVSSCAVLFASKVVEKLEKVVVRLLWHITGTGMAAFCYAIPVCRIHHNLYMKNGLFV